MARGIYLPVNTFNYLISVSLIGLANKVSLKTILTKIYLSIKSIATPIIILLLVGALAGTWKVSGVIPAMVYYGLQLIDPSVFLPFIAYSIIHYFCCYRKLYTTSATIGIASSCVGTAFQIPSG